MNNLYAPIGVAAKAIASEALRLKLLGMVFSHIDANINARAEIASDLAANALPDGSVWVQVWERDCDGVEGYDSYRIKASLPSYYCEYERIAERAEGPFSLSIIPSEGSNMSVGLGWGIN
jgi:hypothetical protein